ncbi:MAG: DUF5050 domain-containing protein [Eubacteriales bacterium]|nr:DUF5050 domain-containing protein [Eubacteriales bacterium]
MKKWALYLLAAILLLGCCGCESRTPLPDADTTSPLVKTGGIAAQKGEWTYFINGLAPSDERDFGFGKASVGALVRVNADRSRRDVVVPQIVLSFTIAGEWIYYISPKVVGDDEIGAQYCRCRVDGTGYRVLSDVTDYTYFEIAEDGLFCCRNDRFWFCDHEFGHKKALADVTIYGMLRDGDTVYYSQAVYYAAAENYYPVGVYAVGLDGQGRETLTNRSYLFVGATDDRLALINYTTGQTELLDKRTGTVEARVYTTSEEVVLGDERTLLLSNYSEASGLYVYDTVERTFRALFSGKALNPRLYEGKVYFYNGDDQNRLYAIPLNGEEEAARLSRHVCGTEMAPQFLDGYLYYMNADDSNYAYRIDLKTGVSQYIAYIAH